MIDETSVLPAGQIKHTTDARISSLLATRASNQCRVSSAPSLMAINGGTSVWAEREVVSFAIRAVK
jgi:hypothetical protein